MTKTIVTIVITLLASITFGWALIAFILEKDYQQRMHESSNISRSLGEDTYRVAILEYNIQFKDSVDFIKIDSIADRINFKNGY